jgi:hypothetical protein
VVSTAPDGRVAEAFITWKAPDTSDIGELEVSVSLEMGSNPEDDIVLKADAKDIRQWSWIASNHIDLSSRFFLNFLISLCLILISRISQHGTGVRLNMTALAGL